MQSIILKILEASIDTKRACIERNLDSIVQAADMLTTCIEQGRKVLIFGNGGSAADAQHLAVEFVNRFQIERPPLAALALTTDASVLTSIGNDYHFNDIFSKQVSALGREGDVAWGISTSGNSVNVIEAMRAARKIGLATIGSLRTLRCVRPFSRRRQKNWSKRSCPKNGSPLNDMVGTPPCPVA